MDIHTSNFIKKNQPFTLFLLKEEIRKQIERRAPVWSMFEYMLH